MPKWTANRCGIEVVTSSSNSVFLLFFYFSVIYNLIILPINLVFKVF